MPNKPATPTRSIRIPDELWQSALARSVEEETTVTEVVNNALKRFIRRKPTKENTP